MSCTDIRRIKKMDKNSTNKLAHSSDRKEAKKVVKLDVDDFNSRNVDKKQDEKSKEDELKIRKRKKKAPLTRRRKSQGITSNVVIVQHKSDTRMLRKQHDLFRRRDSSGEVTTAVNLEKFQHIIKSTCTEEEVPTDEEIALLFNKIDILKTGKLEWRWYLDFILVEHLQKDTGEGKGFGGLSTHIEMLESNHKEPVFRIMELETYVSLNKQMVKDFKSSQYITVSSEGALNMWDLEWNLERHANLQKGKKSKLQPICIDACVMSNCFCIAVSTDNLKISFYNVKAEYKVEKKFELTHLSSMATSMDYMISPDNFNVSVLMWGDAKGSLYYMRFYDNPYAALFNKTFCKGELPLSLLYHRQLIVDVSIERLSFSFDSPVQSIRLYRNRKGNEVFIACCADPDATVGLIYGEVQVETSHEDPKIQKYHFNQLAIFRNAFRVRCLHYDEKVNLFVTGHQDGVVRLWNPYVPLRCTMMLAGHATPVTMVILRSEEKRVLSVGNDTQIRIWSLVDACCTNIIGGLQYRFDYQPFSSIFFDPFKLQLAIATSRIGIFRQKDLSLFSETSKKKMTHHGPVTGLLYSSEFNVVLSSSIDSRIFVWDLSTGKKNLEMIDESRSGLSSMTFDDNKRRVITGSRKGLVTMWNFHNGCKLRSFQKSNENEVSAIAYSQKNIYAGSWNRGITCYWDYACSLPYRKFKRCHSEDVSSMDYHHVEDFLASSSMDGDIFIWNANAGTIIFAFNMFISICPMVLKSRLGGLFSKSKQVSTPLIASTAHGDLRGEHTQFLPDNLPWLRKKSEEEANKTLPNTIDRAVTKIICLQNRVSDKEASLLASTGSGYICAWSTSLVLGGLKGYFPAIYSTGTDVSITSMDSFDDFETLITGDSEGYVQMWNIKGYCDEKQIREHKLKSRQEEGKAPKWFVPITDPPSLLLTERCHISPLVSVALVRESNVFITSSLDCNVRLWSLNGRYLATFGNDMWRNLSDLRSMNLSQTGLPLDLEQWRYLKRLEVKKIQAKKRGIQPEAHEHNLGFSETLNRITEDLFNKAEAKYVVVDSDDEGDRTDKQTLTVWLNNEPCRLTRDPFGYAEEKLDDTYQRLVQDKINSGVAFPSQRRNRRPIKNIRWNPGASAIIYNQVEIVQMDEAPRKLQLPFYYLSSKKKKVLASSSQTSRISPINISKRGKSRASIANSVISKLESEKSETEMKSAHKGPSRTSNSSSVF